MLLVTGPARPTSVQLVGRAPGLAALRGGLYAKAAALRALAAFGLSAGLICGGSGLLGGCSSCEPEAEAPNWDPTEDLAIQVLPEARDPLGPPGATSVKMDLAATTLPAEVPLLVQAKSFEAFATLWHQIESHRAAGGSARPDPAAATKGLAQLLGMDDVAWMDTEGPAWLFFVGPPDNGLGETLVVSVGDQKKLRARLQPVLAEATPPPTSPSTTDPASAADPATVAPVVAPPVPTDFLYKGEGGDVRVAIVGGLAVIARTELAISVARTWIAQGLRSWRPPLAVAVTVDLDLIKKRFPSDVAMARDQLAAGETGPIKKGWLPLVDASSLVWGVDNLRQAVIATEYRDGAIHLEIRGEARKASPLHLAMAVLKGHRAADLSQLPTATWAAASHSWDAKGVGTLVAKAASTLNEAYSELLDLTPEEGAASAPLWDELLRLLTGRGLHFVYREGTFPVSTSLLLESEDAARSRILYDRLLDTLYLRILPRIQDGELLGDNSIIPNGDFPTMGSLLEKLNESLADTGLRIGMTRNRGVTSVDALTVHIDWSKYGADEPNADAMREVIGDEVGVAIAFRDKLIGAAFGVDAGERALYLASGQPVYEGMTADSDLPATAPGTALTAVLRVSEMAQAMEALSHFETTTTYPQIEGRGMLEAQAGTDGKVFRFRLAVPANVLPLFRE